MADAAPTAEPAHPAWLARMEAPLADGAAEIVTRLGAAEERVDVRLWRGSVLVDWEPDDQAGGCLLRPALVQRLLLLGAPTKVTPDTVVLRAGPPMLSALSPAHARLASTLTPAPSLDVRLDFARRDGAYRGGEERYVVPRGAARSGDLVLLRVRVSVRAAPAREPRA